MALDAKTRVETASQGDPAAFAPHRPSGGPQAPFQHNIPHLSEAAISNLYMARWDYFSPIRDTAAAHAARHTGTGPRNAGYGQRDVPTGPLPASGQLFGGTGPLRIPAAKPGTSACSDGHGFPGQARFPRIGPVPPDRPGSPGWVLAVASSSAQLILAHETAHPTRPAPGETCIP